MITFSQLEKKGNLGNQLFQIASTMGIAIRNNQDFAFPKWSHQHAFLNELPVLERPIPERFSEPNFGYRDYSFEKDADLFGYFQSELFFDVLKTEHYFTFKPNFVTHVKQKLQKCFEKEVVLISIRRGDFVNHPDYYQLPISYYLLALLTEFPDWESKNLLVCSDDLAYAKFHFDFLPNVFFPDGLSGLEQLAAASLAKHFIISNSTFSWWSAWFGEKNGGKIIRPLHNFTDEKRARDNDADYYPKRWQIFEPAAQKLDLGGTILQLESENLFWKQYLERWFCNFSTSAHTSAAERSLSKYFLPPFALYYICQKKHIDYYLFKVLKISRFYDKDSFLRMSDFGFYTLGFNTSVPRFSAELCSDSNHPISIKVAEFGGIFATRYIRKYYFRTAMIFVKSNIKKMLKFLKIICI